MTRPSVVFLDRDGTIIRDVHYLSRPEQVELLAGAAAAIRRLNEANVPVVVVTNQSGIARGLLSVEDYERAREQLDRLLAQHGARVDASYVCPHFPDTSGECGCRKPATGLFRSAIAEQRLDMSNPAFVGDRWRDVAPYRELGGTALLLRSDSSAAGDTAMAYEAGVRTVGSLAEGVDILLDSAGTTPA